MLLRGHLKGYAWGSPVFVLEEGWREQKADICLYGSGVAKCGI